MAQNNEQVTPVKRNPFRFRRITARGLEFEDDDGETVVKPFNEAIEDLEQKVTKQHGEKTAVSDDIASSTPVSDEPHQQTGQEGAEGDEEENDGADTVVDEKGKQPAE